MRVAEEDTNLPILTNPGVQRVQVILVSEAEGRQARLSSAVYLILIQLGISDTLRSLHNVIIFNDLGRALEHVRFFGIGFVFVNCGLSHFTRYGCGMYTFVLTALYIPVTSNIMLVSSLLYDYEFESQR